MTDSIITSQIADFGAKIALNSKLQDILEILKDLEPEVRMGVLAMAQAQSFRAVTVKHAIIDGPRKKLIMTRVLADMEAKIRKYGWNQKS